MIKMDRIICLYLPFQDATLVENALISFDDNQRLLVVRNNERKLASRILNVKRGICEIRQNASSCLGFCRLTKNDKRLVPSRERSPKGFFYRKTIVITQSLIEYHDHKALLPREFVSLPLALF